MSRLKVERESNEGLKVLQVVATAPPHYTGTGTVAFMNSRELTKLGYDVHLAAPTHDAPSTELIEDVHVHRLAASIRIGNAARMRGLASTVRPQLVHLHAPFILGGEQAYKMSRRLNVPLAITYHQDLIQSGWIGAAFDAYTRGPLQKMLRAADVVFVPTVDYARESCLSKVLLSHPRLVELPNGVDPERFTPAASTAAIPGPWNEAELSSTFLFVGGMDRAHFFKGVEVLLSALARMNQKEGRLLLVGDGELRPRYELLAEKLKIRDRVHFAGRVGPDTLIDCYRATRCTVLPSTTRGEIFGVVLVEAMACGKPTIATNLPGVRTVVDEKATGLLVPPGDSEALARAMDAMLSELDVHELGKQARAKASQQYAWTMAARTLASSYEEVMA